MSPWLQHLPVLPVAVPLFAGAAMLLIPESRRHRAVLAIIAVLVQLLSAVALLYLTTDAVPDIWSKGIGVYMLVVGATVLMLVALAHQSLRSYRRPAMATSGTDVRIDSAVAPPTAEADT